MEAAWAGHEIIVETLLACVSASVCWAVLKWLSGCAAERALKHLYVIEVVSGCS